MLKSLGLNDMETFNMYVNSDAALCEHLLGYGIVARGVKSHYFRIGIVKGYFENLAQPTPLLSQEDRLAEISSKRNAMERKLRSLLSQVFKISSSPKDRFNQLVGKLAPDRRNELTGRSFAELVSLGESPLYFNELKTIILGHWEKFSNALEMDKSEFEYHMNTINRSRSDAHSKDIDDQMFDKWRISITELSSRLDIE